MGKSADGECSALLANDSDIQERCDVQSSSSTMLCDESARTGITEENSFPWSFAISLYILVCMIPLTFELIFPFVNQMILENGITTDPERVGFYSGLIESIFAFASFLSIMPCTYLSDRVGRRPVLLAGILGLAISTTLFGVSKTFSLMITTRLIGGTLGGTVATQKVMMAERFDESHQGFAFATFVVAYRMGQIVGQPIGGLLSHPERHWQIFHTPFWHKYPFAFPCFIAAGLSIFGLILAYFFLEETLPSKRRKRTTPSYGSTTPTSEIPSVARKASPSVLSVLTPQVVGTLVCSSAMAFLSEAIFALFPLFAFTPIDSGGLGFSEAQIGTQMALRSMNNILVILMYAPLERRIGLIAMLRLSMAFWPLTIVYFPMLNVLARHGWEGTWMLQALLVVFTTFWSFASLSWTASAMVINNSAPSAKALATVNGLAQMALTLPMAVAPAFFNSLFAFSIKHEAILDGNLVYAIHFALGLVGVICSLLLKESNHDWRKDMDDDDEEEADT